MVETCREGKKIQIKKTVVQPELFIACKPFTNAPRVFTSTNSA